MGSLESQLGSIVEGAVRAALADQLPKALPKALEAMRMPPRAADGEDYLTLRDAAAIAKYHKRTLTRHIAMGTLTTSGLHGNRIARSELDRWMAEMAKGARSRKGPPSGSSLAAGGVSPGPGPANDDDDDIAAEVDRLLNDDE